jgi:hypothetical protein
VATRAGVAENVFREVFPTAEDCYRAAYQDGVARLWRAISEAAVRERGWLERVRSGLVALLGFFDDEVSWARFLVLEAFVDVGLAFECGRQLQDVVSQLLNEPGEARVPVDSAVVLPELTGELVVGGVLSVIRASILEEGSGKLVELAPSLMAFIVAPYLGRAAAQAELEGRPAGAGGSPAPQRRPGRGAAISRAAELPVRATHRTTVVLRAIARAPYSNNREIAHAAGLADEGQTSKLLARLERQGVVENVGLGPARGEPNAWVLTTSGRRTVELINQSFASGAPRPRRARA